VPNTLSAILDPERESRREAISKPLFGFGGTRKASRIELGAVEDFAEPAVLI